MNFPSELQYSKSHEWVRRQGDTAEIGLTDYAQSELGGIVFVNLPQVGDEVTMGEALGDVESVKSVSDVYSPVTGVVSEVNEALLDTPEAINQDPYGAWLVKAGGVSGGGDLMDAAAYEAYCAGLGG